MKTDKKKIDKKRMASVVEMATDKIIAGQDPVEIIEHIMNQYILLGYASAKAEEMSKRVVRSSQNRLEGNRRLYRHDKPSTVDLDDEYEVILYIRDLFNLSPLLQNELDPELLHFIQQLKKHGWGDKQVHSFITKAGKHTNFEYASDSSGKRLVPRQIPERGDRQEYLRNRFRLSK